MLNPDKFPTNWREQIEEMAQQSFNQLSPREGLKYWLNYQGIYGYTDQILEVWEKLLGAEEVEAECRDYSLGALLRRYLQEDL